MDGENQGKRKGDNETFKLLRAKKRPATGCSTYTFYWYEDFKISPWETKKPDGFVGREINPRQNKTKKQGKEDKPTNEELGVCRCGGGVFRQNEKAAVQGKND